MGNKHAKPPTVYVAPVAAAAADRRCDYRLSFTASASRYDEDPLSPEEMDTASEQLADVETWREYIVSATRDALLDASDNEPLLYGMEVAFTREQEPHTYNGSISWNGPACDLKRLRTSLDWFIGDRMSQYEIGDDVAGWRVHVEVNKLRKTA